MRAHALEHVSTSILEDTVARDDLLRRQACRIAAGQRAISTDRAKTFKPDPRAYALGVSVLKQRREEIPFSAFGGWDAAGARCFGYPTFWVDRLAQPPEEPASGPHASGETLLDLARWIDAS